MSREGREREERKGKGRRKFEPLLRNFAHASPVTTS